MEKNNISLFRGELSFCFVSGSSEFCSVPSGYIRVLAVLRGSGEMDASGRFVVKKGDLVAVNRAVSVSGDSIDICEITFEKDIIRRLSLFCETEEDFCSSFFICFPVDSLGKNDILRRELTDTEKAVRYIKSIYAESEMKELGWEMSAASGFAALAVLFARSREPLSEEHGEAYARSAAAAAEFMELNYPSEINVDKLASMVSLSPRHFARIFNRTYGIPPMKYLSDIRLRHAAALLAETDKPVTEISLDCGFNDSTYFSKQFKRRFSVTPRKYRADKRKF